MSFNVTLVGALAHENTPSVALYAVGPTGRIGHKIAAVADNQIELPRGAAGTVALGPDVADPGALDPRAFVTLRLADVLPEWEKTGVIAVPATWWRGWLWFTICVTGSVSRCTPWLLDLPALRSIGLGQTPIIFPEHCAPLCSGVVEVWESVTCCWPLPIYQVPRVIDAVAQFLEANPIMFPPPPLPSPGPVERAQAARVDRALAAGVIDHRFLPSSDLSQHLQALRAMPAQEAPAYLEANPMLWPFCCTTNTALLGETTLNPDGSFGFCYRHFPFFLFNCRTSYFYKVRQTLNGLSTYVYDGQAAGQYFLADQVANLTTQAGQTCVKPSPIPAGTITLNAIGATDAWFLDSHWRGMDGAGNDLTQTGEATMPTAGDPNAGLVLGSGAPWTGTLWLSLNVDEGMKALGAVYYRLSTVQANLDGTPLGTPAPISGTISWNWLDGSVFPPVTRNQVLGPFTPAGSPNNDLFTIPYFADHDWLGVAGGPAGLFHQALDTASLINPVIGAAGKGNGQYMLLLEVFDAGGNRLVPAGVPLAGGDVAAPFSFVRLLGAPPAPATPGPVSVVNFGSLSHMIWVDNRPVAGDIGWFGSSGGTQTCQFIKGALSDDFYAGYYAYHTVMCDNPLISPIPSATFMSSYYMGWQEGLHGSTGELASGGALNQPSVCPEGTSYASTPGTTFATMLDGETACAFAIALTVWPKHTDGFGTVPASSWTAAVALSV